MDTNDKNVPVHDIRPPGMSDYLSGKPVTRAPLPQAPLPKPRSFLRTILVFMVLAIVLVPFSCGTLFLFLVSSPSSDAQEKEFSVVQGESVSDIAKDLYAQHFIRSAFAFRVLLTLQKRAGAIKSGDFRFSPSMSSWRIAEILTAKAPAERDSEVTIPEGFTVEQIDKRLADVGLVSPGAFKNAAFEGCDRMPQGVPCVTTVKELEGFLFPDTYRFSKHQIPQAIALKIVANFGDKVTPDLRKEMADNQRSLEDVVTMASLIEQEVRKDEDRALVSGILWKRLSLGIALQVDATVLYAKYGGRTLTKEERVLDIKDLSINSPYNTYKYPGLPKGPIANPGLASIIAAIRPRTSDYLYYLSAPDGTTIFSRTLEEHNRAKAQYLR